MKHFLAALLIGAFAAVAVFGSFLMNHEGSHGSCIAVAAHGGADCSRDEGAWTFIAFHLDAFKSFSTAVFGHGADAALALTSAAFLLLFYVSFAKVFARGRIPLKEQKRSVESVRFAPTRELMRWIGLHERRDPALAYAGFLR